jgi:hypothetical protein
MVPDRRFDYIFTQLGEKFPDEKVLEKKSGKPHYITARQVMNRLDEVLGPVNWWDEYRSGGSDSILCLLTIRLPDGQELTKCDAGGFAGMADQGDDDKSGYSDAFKRAAVKFGVGRYLRGDGVPQLQSRVDGPEHQPEPNQVVQGKASPEATEQSIPITTPQKPRDATKATQVTPEPESRGLAGNPFPKERSFWNDILDAVAQANGKFLEDFPDSQEEPVSTNAVVMFLNGVCYEGKVHPIPPDATDGPDGKPMTPARWAGVLNKVARTSPDMHQWLVDHMKHFIARLIEGATKIEKRGKKGPR